MFSDDLAVRVEASEPLWDVTSEWPDVKTWIGDDLAPALRAGVPALRDVNAVLQGSYVRPPGHRRSFYAMRPDGVLAIKGSEVFAANFSDFLDELAKARVLVECRLGSPALDRTLSRAELSGLDKLPILEGKVPGCVTVREALGEAHAAYAVQRAYVARYGEPARLPLPIFVGKWPQSRVDLVRDELVRRLRGRAWHIVEAALADGLAVYVYRYPTLPLRLAHLAVPDVRKGRDMRKRLETVGQHFDPRKALEGWLELTARFFALGFVPKDPASVVTGDCLQIQNVCLDGGVMDAESLIASKELDERALRDAIRRTVHELAIDATRLLFGLTTSTIDLRDRLPELAAIVWGDLAARVEPGADPRIGEILRARPDTYTALLRTLELAF